jgi:hypothetical protein
MKSSTLTWFALIVLLVGVLGACAAVQAPAAAPASAGVDATQVPPMMTPDAAGAAPAAKEDVPDAALVVPIDAAECETLRAAIAERLRAEMTAEEVDFASEVANRQGTACTVKASGTGVDFGNFIDVAQTIREVLLAHGWVENQAYLADAPTGTSSGYEKGDELALAHVDWQPVEDAECPADQPISACELEPYQRLFTIVVEFVKAS